VEGGVLSLSSLRGRPVILVFHRSYFCAPCRQQLSELKKIYPFVRERGGEILVLSAEERELSARLKREEGLPFPVLADDGRAGRAFGVYNLLGDGLDAPAVFVIDGQGVVRWKQVGRHFADLASPSRVRSEFRKVVGR
jgi:peroxiredoxin